MYASEQNGPRRKYSLTVSRLKRDVTGFTFQTLEADRKGLRNVLAAAVVFGLGVSPGIYAQEPAKKPAPADKTQSQAGNKQEQTTIQLPVMVLVPIQVSTELENKGCWVKLYDKKNYEGDSLMLSGPINMGQMIGPFGFDWEDKVRSLKTGPKANLTIYDNRNFRDQNKFMDVNANIPDMSEKMGYFDNFRSMMLSCK